MAQVERMPINWYKDSYPSDRRKGNTYRTLMWSISMASSRENYRVAILFGSVPALNYAMDMAFSMTRVLGSFVTFSRARRKMEIGNGSSIHFILQDGIRGTEYRGMRWDTGAIDGSVDALNSRDIDVINSLTKATPRGT